MDKIRRRGIKFGIGIPVVLIALFALARTTSDDTADQVVDTTAAGQTLETTPGEEITGVTPCPKTDGTEKRVTTFEQAPPTCIDAAKK